VQNRMDTRIYPRWSKPVQICSNLVSRTQRVGILKYAFESRGGGWVYGRWGRLRRPRSIKIGEIGSHHVGARVVWSGREGLLGASTGKCVTRKPLLLQLQKLPRR